MCPCLSALASHVNKCFYVSVCLVCSKPSGLQRFYSLSYMWYSGFSCSTVILIGLIVSFLTGRGVSAYFHPQCNTTYSCNVSKMFQGPLKEEDVTPGTVYPLMGKLLCFLPEHLKMKLCCVTPLGQTVSDMLNCSIGKFCLSAT